MVHPDQRSPIGRLAPSPTGPLHLGNLATFAVAAARVRRAGGRLLIRNEDLDRDRTIAGMFEEQLADLQWLGISVDSSAPVLTQSERTDAYCEALQRLSRNELVYPCTCSRKDVADSLSAPHGIPADAVYPGTCAHRHAADAPADAWIADSRMSNQSFALRFRCAGHYPFVDAFAGAQTGELTHWHDFVVRRRDGCFAYQLAVVVDDIASSVTEVVRGADLLDSTPRQLVLYAALGAPAPAFAHTPILLDARGERLSKRGLADGVARLKASGWTGELVIGAIACMLGRERFEPLSIAGLAHALPTLRGGLASPVVHVPDSLWLGPDAWARTTTER